MEQWAWWHWILAGCSAVAAVGIIVFLIFSLQLRLYVEGRCRKMEEGEEMDEGEELDIKALQALIVSKVGPIEPADDA